VPASFRRAELRRDDDRVGERPRVVSAFCSARWCSGQRCRSAPVRPCGSLQRHRPIESMTRPVLARRNVLTYAVSAMLAAGGLGVLCARQRPAEPAALRRRANALGARHGLRIDYGAPTAFFVPPYGPEDAVIPGGTATPVDPSALPPALDGIEEALAVYPAGFVSTVCKGIFVCGSLTLDGAEAGGTFGPAWLILVATLKVRESGIYETCRLGVHHELSSLIWAKLPDVQVRWSALMPADWTPAKTNAEVLIGRQEQEDRSDGFLSAYGSTTSENDFNVYAETMFAFPSRLLAAASRAPVVARKAALIFEAYERLDPRFREMFMRRGLDGLRSNTASSEDLGLRVSPVGTPRGEIVRPGDGH